MPKKPTKKPTPQERYWQQRVRTKGLRRALALAVGQELKVLSGERVKDLLDPALVRTLIENWDIRLVDREVVATLLIQVNRHWTARLERQGESVLDLLDKQLVADVEALFSSDPGLSPRAEEFINRVMEQEFVRKLFMDVVFTGIVSFNQKVNPLFGAITMRVLEEQIKGFIRLFMPALQRQAVAFAVSQGNQRIVLEFSRSIVRQILDQPLREYVVAGSGGQRKRVEAVIKKAVTNARLSATIRAATVAAWEDLYRSIRDNKVGELLRLDEHTTWLAERIVDAVLPVLSRPQIVRFVAAEMDLAGTARLLLK